MTGLSLIALALLGIYQQAEIAALRATLIEHMDRFGGEVKR